MRPFFNHHTHTRYCDGSAGPEEYIQTAIGLGFHTLGFSGHAPVPFRNDFAIGDEAELMEYCRTVRQLRDKYKDRINVYLGLELDYISGISEDFIRLKDRCGLDFTIGSVHLVRNGTNEGLWFIDGPKVESFDAGLKDVFGGDIRAAVTTYYEQVNEMLLTQAPDILGHFDKVKMHNRGRYFREEEPWYRSLVLKLIDTIRNTGVIAEVNTRGIYKKRCSDLYPGNWILEILAEEGIPVTLSSDAHRPEELDGYYAESLEILKTIGFKSLKYLGPDGWQDYEIFPLSRE